VTAKNPCKSVARTLQDIVKRELGIDVTYTHCLYAVRKYMTDDDRPRTTEAFAAYVFDKEYP